MLEGKGKVWKASARGGHTIYIPAKIVNDSAYPFEPREAVHVRLDPERKRIIVSKEEERRTC